MKKYRRLACPISWMVLFLLAGCSLIEPSPGHEDVTAATATQRSVAYPPPVGTPYPPPPTPVDTPLPPVLSVMPLAGTGLTWYECEGVDWFALQVCENLLGFQLKEEYGDSKLVYGENVTDKGLFYWRIRLKISRDIYELINPRYPEGVLAPNANPDVAEYRLDKNGELLSMIDTSLWIIPAMLEVGGKYALQLNTPNDNTIIYNGVDLRQAFDLDGAAAAWELNDRLIFVAYKDELYFVMYEGEQIGPEFNGINIFDGETLQFEVRRAPEQYWFRAYRESRYYVVAIIVDQ